MGSATVGVVSSDMRLFKKALKKFSDKNNYTVTTHGNSGESFFVDILPVNRKLFVHHTVEVQEIRKDLPKGTRKLKNARSLIYLSFGKDGEAQDLMVDLIKCHDKHGYVQLNDCGHGKYIEVNANGLVTPNLNKYQPPQMVALRKFYNDLPIELPTVSLEEAIRLSGDKEFDDSNIAKVYVDNNPATDRQSNVTGVKSTQFYSDMVLVLKSRELPVMVNDGDLYNLVGSDSIMGSHKARAFINNISKDKVVFTQGKDRCDIFPV